MGFIEQIAEYVQKYAPQYGIMVHSPIIGQMVLECDSGTSELAVNANNYAGLKHKPSVTSDFYIKVGSEQNADGTYTSSVMKWCKFPDMEAGVKGYFDFISAKRYENLKGVTDPLEYLEKIKADGYATSLKYVQNVMAVIEKYNLTQYDTKRKDDKVMSNSPLVDFTLISPNSTNPRKSKIKKITIHHMAGNLSVESCGNVFQNKSRKASSNYGIGTDGRVGLYVDEKNRAWTSSNADNDNQAVTIEVANDSRSPDWHVSDKALAKLIDLCVDICKRNGIEKLNFTGDKSGNLTMHKYFTATACPGPYLESKFPYIANEVNKRLENVEQPATQNKLYRVQCGAFRNRNNAEALMKRLETAGFDSFIVEVDTN